MSSRYQLIGTIQSGVRNVFAGATVYTLSAQPDPFVANLRLVISGSAGVNPTTWIIRVQQGIWAEEWYGSTTGGASVALVLNDLFFVSDEAITITLENNATDDIAVTVDAGLYVSQPTAGQQAAIPIERSPTDTRQITFSFPGPSLTLTGTRSINDGTFTAVSGTIAYLRSEGGSDLYTLSYNVADRPTAEGVVRYRFVRSGWVSGDPERFVTLRIVGNTVGTNLDKTGYALTSVTGLGNQTANITGNLTGSVGSVTGNVGGSVVGSVGSVAGNVVGSVGSVAGNVVGSVGSVLGNVAGNVVGSVGSVTSAVTVGTINAAVITATAIADNALAAAKIANGALTSAKFASGAFDAVWSVTTRTLTTVADSSGVTTLLSRIASALTITGGKVTVGTNDDKSGYSLTPTTGLGNQTSNITGNLSGSVGSVTTPVIVGQNNDKVNYQLTSSAYSAIASVVEEAILEEGDGRAVLSAIANAVRLEIERNGGMLDIVPTLTEIEASSVLAKQSNFTGLATSANVTATQTALTNEINQNEAKLDTVISKTNLIPSNPAAVSDIPTPDEIVQGTVTGSQPAGSLARFIRDIKQADILFEGVIISATSNTAKLNGNATTVCVGQLITIGEEGNIERQSRYVTAFDPVEKVVTLDKPWCVVPPNGSDYQIKTLRRSGDATEAKQDVITDEVSKIPRAANAIDAGKYRLTIEGGQAANVTPSEVV